MDAVKRKNALLSVCCKDGIVDFCDKLLLCGDWQFFATSGTYKLLKQSNFHVIDVATLIGTGPILDHRIASTGWQLHAGLVAKNTPEHLAELERLNLVKFDLLCVDLYPLLEEINRPDSTPSSVEEKTDIGGPTMIRFAAKGKIPVICLPEQREIYLRWLEVGEPDREWLTAYLASRAEQVVADYCQVSADYLKRYHNSLLDKPTHIKSTLASQIVFGN